MPPSLLYASQAQRLSGNEILDKRCGIETQDVALLKNASITIDTYILLDSAAILVPILVSDAGWIPYPSSILKY